MIKQTSWNLAQWVRWLGLLTLLFALIGLVLSLINATVTQQLALGLVIFANRMALVEAVLGVVVCWQRRRWGWVVAQALAGALTLMSGPISGAINSNIPFVLGPILVGALGLAAVGWPGLLRLRGSAAR